jgi:putative nucleotidyltransferase with HDIG domain
MQMQTEKRSDERVRPPWAHLRIPPFPLIAIRILQLTNQEDVPMRALSDLISSEPAFSSEVLTIANSALYARRVPITSVLQAIAVLGTKSLKGICLTIGVRAYLGDSVNHQSLRAIWRHSLACALIADPLAKAGGRDKNAAYTAGIMHDIGRLALAVLSPDAYAALLEKHTGPAASVLEEERELFGFDHCEAGLHLIADWRMPAYFKAVVGEHHARRVIQDSWQMPDLINVACRMADTVGFSVFAGCEVAPYADLLAELPDAERKTFYADAEVLGFEVASKINALEFAG